MQYDQVLPDAFPYVVVGAGAETVRRLATALLEPRPDFAADGSSFAVTARPEWTLWLSSASHDRIRDLLPKDEYVRFVFESRQE